MSTSQPCENEGSDIHRVSGTWEMLRKSDFFTPRTPFHCRVQAPYVPTSLETARFCCCMDTLWLHKVTPIPMDDRSHDLFSHYVCYSLTYGNKGICSRTPNNLGHRKDEAGF